MDVSRNRSADANRLYLLAVRETGIGNVIGIVTAIVIAAGTGIVIGTATETETVTATAAETVMRTEIRVLAITIPALSPVLIPDRLTIPDADVTASNRYAVALSFWLTEGKGNDKLNFGTSQKALSDLSVRI